MPRHAEGHRIAVRAAGKQRFGQLRAGQSAARQQDLRRGKLVPALALHGITCRNVGPYRLAPGVERVCRVRNGGRIAVRSRRKRGRQRDIALAVAGLGRAERQLLHPVRCIHLDRVCALGGGVGVRDERLRRMVPGVFRCDVGVFLVRHERVGVDHDPIAVLFRGVAQHFAVFIPDLQRVGICQHESGALSCARQGLQRVDHRISARGYRDQNVRISRNRHADASVRVRRILRIAGGHGDRACRCCGLQPERHRSCVHDPVGIGLRQRRKRQIRRLHDAVRVLRAQRLQRRHAREHEPQLHALHAAVCLAAQPEARFIALRAQPDDIAQGRDVAARREILICDHAPVRLPVGDRHGQILRRAAGSGHIRVELPGIRVRDLRDHRMRLLLRCGVRDAQAVLEPVPIRGAGAFIGA